MEDTIDLYSAIDQMRSLSKNGSTFSMSYCTFSGKQSKVKLVRKAILRESYRPGSGLKKQYLVNYFDLDKNENRQFYKPLLLSFNGLKVVLK